MRIKVGMPGEDSRRILKESRPQAGSHKDSVGRTTEMLVKAK